MWTPLGIAGHGFAKLRSPKTTCSRFALPGLQALLLVRFFRTLYLLFAFRTLLTRSGGSIAAGSTIIIADPLEHIQVCFGLRDCLHEEQDFEEIWAAYSTYSKAPGRMIAVDLQGRVFLSIIVEQENESSKEKRRLWTS